MYCTKCGNKVLGSAKFCSSCGNALSNNETFNNSQNVNSMIPNETKENNRLALASLIIGAASLMFSSFAPITLISSIVGLILGIVSKNKSKEKTVGIILNIISIVIGIIIVIIWVIFFIAVGSEIEDAVEETEHTYEETVFGIWNCAENNYNDFHHTGYTITLHLNENGTFKWNGYNDELNNHIYGDFGYSVFNKKNFNNTISYNLYFQSDEYVKDGEMLKEIFNKRYTMIIDSEESVATLKSYDGSERYSCDYKIGSISEI